MSAELAIANQIKSYGMRVVSPEKYDPNTMIDVTEDVENEHLVSTVDVHDIFEDGSAVATYQFDGDATDLSGNYDGTNNGVTFEDCKFGQGADFNGSSYIDTNINPKTDVTFSFWINPHTINETGIWDAIFMKQTDGTGTNLCCIYLKEEGIVYANESSSDIYHGTNFLPINVNEWAHLVYSINSTSINVWKNGIHIEEILDNNFLTGAYLNNETFRFGISYSNTADRYYNGLLDQFRILNRTVTNEEVNELYLEERHIKDIEVNTTHIHDIFEDNSIVATYQFNSDATDLGGNYLGTDTNVTYIDNKVVKFSNTKGTVNDPTSYIRVPLIVLNDFTISFDYKKENSAYGDAIIGHWVSTPWDAYMILHTNTINVSVGGISYSTIKDPGFDNNKHNYIFSRSGSNVDIYIDGKFFETIVTSTAVFNLDVIGTYWADGTSVACNGELDQLRIIDRSITSEEASTLYNEREDYKVVIPLQTFKYSNVDIFDIFGDGSILAMYQFNSDATDLGGNYDGVETNMSYVSGRFSQSSIYSNNVDNIIPFVNVTDFSYSVWIKTTQYAGGILGYQQLSDSETHEKELSIHNGTLNFYGFDGAVKNMYSPSRIDDGEWHHIVITNINAVETKMYINNVLVNTANWGALYQYSSPAFHFGKTYFGSYTGELDQFRIFNKALTQADVSTLYNEG